MKTLKQDVAEAVSETAAQKGTEHLIDSVAALSPDDEDSDNQGETSSGVKRVTRAVYNGERAGDANEATIDEELE